MIKWDKFADEVTYNTVRYKFVLWSEETGHLRTDPYLDSQKSPAPTMGVGFNLRELANREQILKEMGLDPNLVSPTIKRKYVDKIYSIVRASYSKGDDHILERELDKVINDWWKDTSVATANGKPKRSSFFLSNDEIENVFNNIAPGYEAQIDKWSSKYGLTIEKYCRERTVLYSLAYNSQDKNRDGIPDLLGPGLANAIKAGNRAEAWYEIRYNTNSGDIDGVAKRRFLESEYFGLYDDANNVSLDDAKQVYRMLQNHRSQIAEKEALFGVAFDGSLGVRKNGGVTILDAANRDYQAGQFFWDGQIDTLETNLNPAMGKILDWLRADCAAAIQEYGSLEFIRSFNILLDPSSNDNNGAKLNARYSRNGIELVIENILIGEGGNDTLIGGKGNDLLLGGEGYDTYIHNTGDGYDTIYDSDKKGKIIINNDYGKPQGLVNMYKKEGYTNVWTDGTGQIQITHHSPWQIVLEDGSTITLGEDFQSGDFGINLIDTPDDPSTTLTITGDLAPVDSDPNTPGVQIQYDALGNVITDPNTPEPDRADTLYDSTGNDSIVGGGGNDQILAENGGDDWLKGGSGNDGIVAGSGHDVLEGGTGADLLFGGTDDDRLFAEDMGEMSDLVEAGETAVGITGQGDLLSGGEGNDFLYGSDRNDALFGGAGSDLLAGGGGDDVILSAGHASAALFDWSYSIETSPNPSGGTSYQPVLTNVTYQSVLLEDTGSDVVYAGTGNDFVYAGNGDDEVYSGSGNDTVFGFGGADFIEGGEGNDILYGDNALSQLALEKHGDDYIDGGEGNDVIYGNGGSDDLYGGAGNDELYGDSADIAVASHGNDYVDGEEGDDLIFGMGGDDVLFGGDGVDTIYGSEGSDEIYGGSGNDLIAGDVSGADVSLHGNDYIDGEEGDDYVIGQGGNDTIFGGSGNDELYGDSDDIGVALHGNDYIDGGEGDDTISGQGGNDELHGDAGIDQILGGMGDDVIYGGDGADLLYGQEGSDEIYGDAGDDYIQGDDTVDGGSDYLDGGEGNDTILGGAGADEIYGGDGADVLHGDAGNINALDHGNDYIDGGAGSDIIRGYGGDDSLYGGAGDDYIQGDAGNDLLAGGDGRDTYYYNIGDGVDTIDDWSTESEFDTVIFGEGITVDDLSISTTEDRLIINVGTSGTDRLELMNFDPDDWF